VKGAVTVIGMYLIRLILCSSKVQVNIQFLPQFSVLRSEQVAFKEDIQMVLVACGYFNLTNYNFNCQSLKFSTLFNLVETM